jgi:hypothetical protein
VLLAFTLDFERESAVSLAVAANALRVLTAGGVRMRELPYLTGVPMGGGRGGPTSARPPPCSTTPELRCPTTRWCCTVAVARRQLTDPMPAVAPDRAGLRQARRGKMEP